jgi:hypothetical protein
VLTERPSRWTITLHLVQGGDYVSWVNCDETDCLLETIPKAGGQRRTLVASPSIPIIAADETFVYYVDLTATKVMRIPAAGGPSETVSDLLNPAYPRGLTTNSTHVYWGLYNGFVGRAPKSGGPEEPLTAPDELDWAGAVVADDAGAFVMGSKDPAAIGADTAFALTGTTAQPLAADSSLYLGLDDSHLFLSDLAFGNDPTGVRRVPRAGGPVDLIEPSANRGIFVAEAVYFIDYTEGRVGRVSKSGGEVETVARAFGDALVADATHVYFVGAEQKYGPNRLFKVKKP